MIHSLHSTAVSSRGIALRLGLPLGAWLLSLHGVDFVFSEDVLRSFHGLFLLATMVGLQQLLFISERLGVARTPEWPCGTFVSRFMGVDSIFSIVSLVWSWLGVCEWLLFSWMTPVDRTHT